MMKISWDPEYITVTASLMPKTIFNIMWHIMKKVYEKGLPWMYYEHA